MPGQRLRQSGEPGRQSGERARRSRSLRQRIASGILVVTSLAVLLFALPLAVALSRLDRSQEIAELQRDATRIAALVPDNPVELSSSVPVPSDPAGTGEPRVGIYTPDGQRVGGQGPVRSTLARGSGDGRVHQGSEAGQLAVAVPVPSDRRVVAVVRAAVTAGTVSSRTHRRWAAMAALGLAVLSVAALLARGQAKRIAVPLERLTTAARALGDGVYTVATEHSGIREADAAGHALRDTAARIGELLHRERAFSADASHQLRTPLTGLLLGLESAISRPQADHHRALGDALDRGRELQRTIDDLLALRRDTGRAAGALDIQAELLAAGERWQPRFAERRRPLAVTVPAAVPPVTASAAAIRQILDVLLDNALQHGGGAVTLLANDLGDAVAVEVGDEGDGFPHDPDAAFARRSPTARGHGIGLALARSLAEADGGRLVIRRAAPGPILALLLPVADTVVATPRAGHDGVGQPSSS